MYKIFIALKSWLARLGEIECPPDPLSLMSPRELADLPISHPRFDR